MLVSTPSKTSPRGFTLMIQCTNNTKQIGLVLHNSESSRRFFPLSGIRGRGYLQHMTINVNADGKILPAGKRAASSRYVFTHIVSNETLSRPRRCIRIGPRHR